MGCASASQAPVSCTAGKYSAETQMDCTDCPVDQSCADPAAAATSCDAGYWSPLVCIVTKNDRIIIRRVCYVNPAHLT